MAHNLEQRNGVTSFASTQKAWHNLGQIVDKAMTAEEAIRLANLGYEVAKVPNYALINGQFVQTPGSFSIHRTDTGDILGDRLGKGYTIVQNHEAFGFFDSIVGGKHAMYETAGVLGKGERIFITAKMPEVIRIAGTDDISEVYVLLTSSHDGSGSIIASTTSVRVVCQNTLNMALKNSINKVSVRHSVNVHDKLAEAHMVLGITHKFIEEANECFNVLAKKSITDDKVKELIQILFNEEKKDSTRIKNIEDAVLECYNIGVGQEKIIGTAWGAYNGITHYLSHVKNYKNEDSKFENILLGNSKKITEDAFNLLLTI